MRVRAVVVIVVAFAFARTASAGPSFNCHAKLIPAEVAICGDAGLGDSDRAISDLYFRNLNSSDARSARAMRAYQIQWLDKRNSCGSNLACLRDVYAARLDELQASPKQTSGEDVGYVKSGEDTWDHNGSMMRLDAQGTHRRFIYETPRPGLTDVGVGKGTVLFDGETNGRSYSGVAYLFNGRCGSRQYLVSGPILDGGEKVVVRGRATRLNDNCRVAGSYWDTLTFTRLGD